MKLYLSGHNYQYALEQSLLTLFPDQRPEYMDAPPAPHEAAAWSTLTVTGTLATAHAKIQLGGRTGSASFSCPAADLTGGPGHRPAAPAADQAVLLPGRAPPPGRSTPSWGDSPASGPAKLASRALESGMTEAETRNLFRETYFVSPSRTELALDAARRDWPPRPV